MRPSTDLDRDVDPPPPGHPGLPLGLSRLCETETEESGVKFLDQYYWLMKLKLLISFRLPSCVAIACVPFGPSPSPTIALYSYAKELLLGLPLGLSVD